MSSKAATTATTERIDDGWVLEAAIESSSDSGATGIAAATTADDVEDGWALPAEPSDLPPALELVPAPADPEDEPEPEAAEAEVDEPAADTPDGPAPHAADAIAFSPEELAFFDAGDDLATPSPEPSDTFADLGETRPRSFWKRLLSRS